ncbi:glycosyltransferase family 9 protein [Maridesulfovibrio hydrothermalis]|uniref:Glycosyl transferase family 9 n=1 Tax=Maridesulfovibrio hydrothermalis AM13 = DSM 14728 TaxID=1121451 RepID=L0RAP1_9BACT|nr:glycosyltransferase family 9 protein [Maridesulfovibrio hydrothermalis]CCO22636.1 Glycosyl transferase family 9 [Maridesulfovibrio hydrothermalis AM13 = DSM 14728]
MKDNYKKIALWQTAFLGDAVLTLPLIKALSLHFPDAEIHLFVRKGVESLFAAQRELAGVHGFDKRGAQKGMGAAFKYGSDIGAQGFDLFISAHTSMRSAVVSRATGISRRIGYDAPCFNRFVYTETVKRRFEELEEVERLMALGGPLGISGTAPRAGLDLPEDAVRQAEDFFAQFTQPVIGVHPGSTWETKKWPEDNFAKIISKSLDGGCKVLLFGGPEEVDLCDSVLRRSGRASEVVNLAGKLSLQQLAAYIRQLGVYLTNDSGPMHIAWVQDVPLVALFGPTVKRFGFFPRGDNSTVLQTSGNLPCRPCGLHGGRVCPEKHHKCMTDISVDMVWSEIAGKLEKQRAEL